MKYREYVVVLENASYTIEKLVTMDLPRWWGEIDARRIAANHWGLSESVAIHLIHDCRLKVYMPETHDELFTPECHPGITPEVLTSAPSEPYYL